MSSEDIRNELVRMHPDTDRKNWKRRSRAKTSAGIARSFEYDDGRLVETIEAKDGSITATNVANLRLDFDRAINNAFRQPLMIDEGYESWESLMEDYAFEHAGEILACAMVGTSGPTPDRFYTACPETGNERLYDNLHGLMNAEYVEHEGRATYEMEVDRSGYSPRIRVFQVENGFDIELVK